MDIERSCTISWVESLASFIPFSLCFLFLFSFFGMHVCIRVWAWLRDQTWRCGGFLRFIDLIFGIRLQLETILQHSNPGRVFFHSRCLPVRFIRAASRPYSPFSRPQQTPPFFRLGWNGLSCAAFEAEQDATVWDQASIKQWPRRSCKAWLGKAAGPRPCPRHCWGSLFGNC